MCRGRAAPRYASRRRRVLPRRAVLRGCPEFLSSSPARLCLTFGRVLTRPFPNRKPPSRHLAPLPGARYIRILNGGDAMADPENAETRAVTAGVRTPPPPAALTPFARMTLPYP